MVADQLKKTLPAPLLRGLYAARDVAESTGYRLTGRPPARIRRVISPLWFDFKKTGADQLAFFVELCGLTPQERFLDIACGVGRIAIPLTRYLGEGGSYEGFDILPWMVEWNTRNITARHPHFRFQVADVTTSRADRAFNPEEYRFPYDDKSFDFAYAGSLYTHLTPAAVENYLTETVRVLKPGGRTVATFMLFDPQSQRLLPGQSFERLWGNDHGVYRTLDDVHPEASVIYDETYVREMYERAGLTVVEPLRPDASYSPARMPARRELGANLWYSMSVIAMRP